MHSNSRSWKEFDGGPELLAPDVSQSPPDHLLLLPSSRNDGRWIFASTTNSVAKLLSSQGVPTRRVVLSEDPLYLDNRSIVWVGPVVFVSLAALAANPNVVSLALSVLANFVSDMIRSNSDTARESGTEPTKNVRLRVIVEVKLRSRYKTMDYEGPAEGLQTLAGAIESAMRDGQENE